MAKWHGIRLQMSVPGAPIAKAFGENIVGPVADASEVAIQFLDLVKSFLFDFEQPVKALVDALIDDVLELIESLRQSGLFFLDLFTDFASDPELSRIKGGYEGFVRRIISSLGDTEDGNRPQFGPNDYMGGVVVVVDAQSVGELVKTVNTLWRFFDKVTTARPAAPTNLVIRPVDSSGLPLESLAAASNFTPGGVLLEWTTPGVLDTFTIPPWFLVERSTKRGSPVSREVEVDTLANLSGDGVQKIKVPVRQHGGGYSEWEVVKKVPYSSAVPKFPGVSDPDSFGLAQLAEDVQASNYAAGISLVVQSEGSHAYVDDTAEEGKSYFYRVRSLYEDLDESKIQIVNDQVVRDKQASEPCAPVSVTVPYSPTSLDMPTEANDEGEEEPVSVRDAMKELFRAAYALQFYRSTTEFFGSVPVGTQSVPEIDARSRFSYLAHLDNVSVKKALVVEDVMSEVDDQISLFSGRVAVRLFRRTVESRLFASAYKDNQSLIRDLWWRWVHSLDPSDLATSIEDPSDVGASESERLIVLKLVNLVKELESFRGQPPNWTSFRLLEDALPFVDEFLSDLARRLRGFSSGYQGITQDVEDYVEFLERRVEVILTLLEEIEEVLQFLFSVDFGIYALLVEPKIGGVDYFVETVNSADPSDEIKITEELIGESGAKVPGGTLGVAAGPGGGPNDYAAGFAITIGAFSEQAFDDTIEAGGDLGELPDTLVVANDALKLIFGG